MQRLNINQQELADITGLAQQQISRYINNENRMSLANAKIFANVFKCHIDDLYEWIEDGK